jgi:CheY-like chemotaxis protein
MVRGLARKLGSGYRFVEAGNGKEGFEMAKAEHPSLIITDYDMPPGMTGVEMLENISRGGGLPPTIIISGNSAEMIQAEVEKYLPQASSALHVLTKPQSAGEIAEHVKRLFER